MRLFVLITILVMTTTMGYAQDENINLQNHFLLANAHVEHIGYIPLKKTILKELNAWILLGEMSREDM